MKNIEYTDEQTQIFKARDKIMIIDAKAGSGKTTTLLEYVKINSDENFLYLVFNRKMREEAEEKIKKQGIKNIKVSTIHSFCMRESGLKLKANPNFNVYNLAEGLNLDVKIVKEYIKLYNDFLNSRHIDVDEYIKENALKIKDLITLESEIDEDMILNKFFSGIKKFIEKTYYKMERGSIDVSFDFFLKYFQIYSPQILGYDVVLIDEAQDISGVMLEIVKEKFKNSRKIFVGDTNQQIYRWRGAVNSLEKIDGAVHYSLSNSFRIGPQIVEEIKKTFNDPNFKIIGKNLNNVIVKTLDQNKKFTYIARSNTSLVSFALLNLNKKLYIPKNVRFELLEAIYSFKYKNDKKGHLSLRPYKSFEILEEDFEKDLIFDNELILSKLLLDKYSTEIPTIIRKLKEQNVDENRADIILTTSHSSKGLEYNRVLLANDFTSKKKLDEKVKKLEYIRSLSIGNEKEKQKIDRIMKTLLEAAEEELNIKYVALTRCNGEIEIPPEDDDMFIFEDKADFFKLNFDDDDDDEQFPIFTIRDLKNNEIVFGWDEKKYLKNFILEKIKKRQITRNKDYDFGKELVTKAKNKNEEKQKFLNKLNYLTVGDKSIMEHLNDDFYVNILSKLSEYFSETEILGEFDKNELKKFQTQNSRQEYWKELLINNQKLKNFKIYSRDYLDPKTSEEKNLIDFLSQDSNLKKFFVIETQEIRNLMLEELYSRDMKFREKFENKFGNVFMTCSVLGCEYEDEDE